MPQHNPPGSYENINWRDRASADAAERERDPTRASQRAEQDAAERRAYGRASQRAEQDAAERRADRRMTRREQASAAAAAIARSEADAAERRADDVMIASNFEGDKGASYDGDYYAYRPGHPCYRPPNRSQPSPGGGGVTGAGSETSDEGGSHDAAAPIAPATQIRRFETEAVPSRQFFRETSPASVVRTKVMVDQQNSYYNIDNWAHAYKFNDIPELAGLMVNDHENKKKIFGWPGLANHYNSMTVDTNYDLEAGFSGPIDRLRWALGHVWIYSAGYASDQRIGVPPDLNIENPIYRNVDNRLFRDDRVDWSEDSQLEYDYFNNTNKDSSFGRSLSLNGITNNGALIQVSSWRSYPVVSRTTMAGVPALLKESFSVSFRGGSTTGGSGIFARRRFFFEQFVKGIGSQGQNTDNGRERISNPNYSPEYNKAMMFGAMEFATRPQDPHAIPTTGREIAQIPFDGYAPGTEAFYDTSHKVHMPFFDDESDRISFGARRNASIKLEITSVPDAYKNFQRRQTFPLNEFYSYRTGRFPRKFVRGEEHLGLPNLYREYRAKFGPEDPLCGSDMSYYDKILKFTDYNILKFADVNNMYRNSMPMTVRIKFQTEQNSTLGGIINKYKLGKYLLDALIRHDGPGTRGPTYGLTNLFFPISDSPEMEDSQLGGYGYTQFLEQTVTFNDGHQDMNYWSNDLNNNPIKNEKIAFRSKIRVHDFELWMNNYITPENLQRFGEQDFPLAAHHRGRLGQFSAGFALLNKIMFKNEFNKKVWESYGDNQLEDEELLDAEAKSLFRSFREILGGKTAYTETIAYRVDKHEVGVSYDLETQKITGIPQQSFYFMDSDRVNEIDFMDTQLLYGKTYKYIITSINLVLGSKYYYVYGDQPSQLEIRTGRRTNIPGYGTIFEMDEPVADIDRGTSDIRTDRDGVVQRGDPNSSPENVALAGDPYILDFVDETLGDPLNEIGNNAAQNQIRERIDDFMTSRAQSTEILLDVYSSPKIILTEVPYFSKMVTILDRPPVPPNIQFYPLSGKPDEVDLIITPGNGKVRDIPKILMEDDIPMINKMLTSQDKKHDGTIEYSGDSTPSFYQIFVFKPKPNGKRMPTRYEDFINFRKIKADDNGTLFLREIVEPNVKAYYMFRAVDSFEGQDYGLSQPSSMYCVFPGNGPDGSFLSVNKYEFPKNGVTYGGKFSKCISISPSVVNNNILTSFVGDEAELREEPLRSEFREANKDKNIWHLGDFKDNPTPNPNRKFRLKVKSKSTGKVIDIDFSFAVSKSRKFVDITSNLPERTDLDCIPPEVSTGRMPSDPRIISDDDGLPPCILPGEIFAQEGTNRSGFNQDNSLVFPSNQGLDDDIWRGCEGLSRPHDVLNDFISDVKAWEDANVAIYQASDYRTAGPSPASGAQSPSNNSAPMPMEFTLIREDSGQSSPARVRTDGEMARFAKERYYGDIGQPSPRQSEAAVRQRQLARMAEQRAAERRRAKAKKAADKKATAKKSSNSNSINNANNARVADAVAKAYGMTGGGGMGGKS